MATDPGVRGKFWNVDFQYVPSKKTFAIGLAISFGGMTGGALIGATIIVLTGSILALTNPLILAGMGVGLAIAFTAQVVYQLFLNHRVDKSVQVSKPSLSFIKPTWEEIFPTKIWEYLRLSLEYPLRVTQDFSTLEPTLKHIEEFETLLHEVDNAIMSREIKNSHNWKEILEKFGTLFNGGPLSVDVIKIVNYETKTEQIKTSCEGLKNIYRRLIANGAHNYTSSIFQDNFYASTKEFQPSSYEFRNRIVATKKYTDMTKNIIPYFDLLNNFLQAAQITLIQIEKEATLINSSLDFFLSALSGPKSTLKERRSLMLHVERIIRQYVTLRFEPGMNGTKDGCVNHFLNYLGKLLEFRCSVFTSIKKNTDGYYVGEQYGCHYLIIGFVENRTNHFVNYFLNPLSKGFALFDTLSPTNHAEIQEIESINFSHFIAIPWKTFQAKQNELKSIDINNWAIPTNSRNNCFVVSSLMLVAVKSFWDNLIK